MNAQTESRLTEGPAGAIELAIDRPDGAASAMAFIAHPHPLHGGTLTNKVVQTMARAAVLAGMVAVRFNFRGVGRSGGQYDEGRGEVDDLMAVVESEAPSGPLVMAGFSFGSYVTCRALQRLHPARDIRHVVFVGTAASRFVVPPIAEELRARALIVHGELDDTVPLSAVMDWARPQSLPVLVMPGGGHFFHGQLPQLRELVWRHWRP
ncbi:alpha/beta hydrolase [uncultured Hydrogenophaga sp.]|uniref:alpha/beta hydrolase n=1 Tax=uncultured Hydrogenophaga sp. TaxID=199683 RepID=UPI002584A9ED|nr:alpha/beta hydrolase [uncultured Hydrogenophaga sp.]